MPRGGNCEDKGFKQSPMVPVSDSIRSTVQTRLTGIENKYQVRILFACESGSRAWGFPSADSDFDVRFIYIHPVDWYLTTAEKKDVIEEPILDDIDLNGWEIRKALQLFRKSNPPLLEVRITDRLFGAFSLCDRSS
jgi:hypothetical protein